MRKDFKSAGAVALSLLASVALVACSKGPDAGGHGGMGNMPPPQVAVVAVQPQTVPVTFEYTGQTFGSKEVEVRARVGGIIEKRLYDEGAPVRAGEVMFELDPKPLQAQVAAAEAEVATAEARAAQASREATRLKPLLSERAVSQQEYDNAVSGQQIAQAGLLSARARLQELRLNLGYTKVVAPVSGIAGRALKSEGSLVTQADSLLTTLVQLNPLYVGFGPSENEQAAIDRDVAGGSLQLPKNGGFEVEIRDGEGHTLARGGRMNFTASRVSEGTGTVEMRAELPNPGSRLKAGQFVRVALHGAVRPAAIVVPQGAVLEGPQSKIVMLAVQKDGKTVVEPRPVEVGEWSTLEGAGGKPESRVWVIRKGLVAGDQVILDNFVKLRPGAPVVPVSPEAAQAAQSAPAAAPAGK